jgi:hypothetical protein
MNLWNDLKNAGQKVWDEGFRDPAEHTLHAMSLDMFNKPDGPKKYKHESNYGSGELAQAPEGGIGLTPEPIEGGYSPEELLNQQQLLANALKQY